jgi:hypothetical protein
LPFTDQSFSIRLHFREEKTCERKELFVVD